MHLYTDDKGRVEIAGLMPTDTVQSLLAALDDYLCREPTGCERCQQSCCAKPWAVAVDAVAQAAAPAAFARLVLRENPVRDANYFVLEKEGRCPHYTDERRCAVYEARPLICRLYLCRVMGPGYALLREVAALAYLDALACPQGDGQTELPNPAVGRGDYGAKLVDLVAYAAQMLWLESEEQRALAQLFAAGRSQ